MTSPEVENLQKRIAELEVALKSLVDDYETVIDQRDEMYRKQDALILAVLAYVEGRKSSDLDTLKMMLHAAMLV